MESSSQALPSRPKEGPTSTDAKLTEEKDTEGAEPSKNAQKKAAKEKEKAEKAAKREQKEKEEREARERADAANDTAAHLYGQPPSDPSPVTLTPFISNAQWTEDAEITVRARVQTTRSQAASTCFLVLGEGFRTLQAVAAEGGGQGVSKQMVKWCKKLNAESLVQVTGLVRKAELKSVTIKEYELHVKSIYMVSEAEEKLPIQTKDCRGPPPAGEGENEGEEAQGLANVGLKARLDNRVLSMRTPASQAIFKLQSGVRSLFVEYMFKHGGTWIEPSYLAGASTEGGADVFEVKYFERRAYLTQSPQFYKQMAIAGDMGVVFTTGPVFRAEHSNTKRHLTEVSRYFYSVPSSTSC
jgi:aspartyl/asparaginyl-tRNA synthetase